MQLGEMYWRRDWRKEQRNARTSTFHRQQDEAKNRCDTVKCFVMLLEVANGAQCAKLQCANVA